MPIFFHGMQVIKIELKKTETLIKLQSDYSHNILSASDCIDKIKEIAELLQSLQYSK